MNEPTLIYNPVFEPFLDNQLRYNVLKGSAGSGKSIAAAQKIIQRILTERGHRILCIRKVATTLRSSVYQVLLDELLKLNLSNEFTINKSEMRFTHISGNEIICVGLDDPEKLKSIAGITSVWCEEATELLESDFMQIDLRLRGEIENYKQIILTFNPIDENHWIKKRFFDIVNDNVFILNTTYKDNLFIDKEYVNLLEQTLKSNENLYRIYVLNEWGRPNTGGEFYKCFRMTKHVKRFNGVKDFYNEDLPLHISFDFNVNPYMTCTIYQIEDKHILQIDELCLKDPDNKLSAICLEFIRKYQSHKSGLFIYGDPSGRKEDVAQEKGHNYFRVIADYLHPYHPNLRIAGKAPPVVERGNFINSIFESNIMDLDIQIGENCKNSIDDLTYCKQASDGTKHKEKAKNADTGVTYEKYGHTSDSLDYMLCYAFSSEFSQYQRGTKGIQITTGKAPAKHGY